MGLGSFKCNKQPSNVASTQDYYRADVLQLMALAWVGLEDTLKKPHSATSSQVLVNPRTMNTTCSTFLSLEWLKSQTSTVGNINTTQ